jgi:hypothetical protein
MDRMLRGAVPRPFEAYAPPPHELAPGLWALDRQLVHFGLARLPSRTTLIRRDDGSLLVISPPPCVDAATIAAIEAIGPVADVVVPNSFHYLYASDFMGHYPAARLRIAPGVGRRAPALPRADELHEGGPGDWAGQLEVVVLGPVRGLSELLFFHVASGSLIVTDLAFNMTEYPRPLDRLVWRLSGIPGGFGPGRTSRSTLLRDRRVAARALARALAWPIRRIVVAHGDVVEDDAAARLRSAFADYLADAPRSDPA